MFGPSLACGINVCLLQPQDMHDMQESVRQSNLSFTQGRVFCYLCTESLTKA